MAARWVEEGGRRLHLVDLNGAFEGKPVNGEIVAAIAGDSRICRFRLAAAFAVWIPSAIIWMPAFST